MNSTLQVNEERIASMWVAAAEVTVSATAQVLDERQRTTAIYQNTIGEVESIEIRVLNDNASLERDCIRLEAMRRQEVIAEEIEYHELSQLFSFNLEGDLKGRFAEGMRSTFLEAPIPEYFGKRFDTKDFREMKHLVKGWVEPYGNACIRPVPSYLLSSKKEVLSWLSRENLFSGRFATLKVRKLGDGEPKILEDILHPMILPFPLKIRSLLEGSSEIFAVASLLERLNKGSISAELILEAKDIGRHSLGGEFVLESKKLEATFALALEWTFSGADDEPFIFLQQDLEFPYRERPSTVAILKGTELDSSPLSKETHKLEGSSFWLGYDLSSVIAGVWFGNEGRLLDVEAKMSKLESLLEEAFGEVDENSSGTEEEIYNKLLEDNHRLDLEIAAAERTAVTKSCKHQEAVDAFEREFSLYDERFMNQWKKKVEEPARQREYSLVSKEPVSIGYCYLGGNMALYPLRPEAAEEYISKTPWSVLPFKNLDVASLLLWMDGQVQRDQFEGRFAVLEDAGEYQASDFSKTRMIIPLKGHPPTKSLTIALLIERLGVGFLSAEASMKNACPEGGGPHLLTVNWYLTSSHRAIPVKRSDDIVQVDTIALDACCKGIPRAGRCQSSALFYQKERVEPHGSSKPHLTNYVASWIHGAWEKRSVIKSEESSLTELTVLLEKSVAYVKGEEDEF